MIVEDNRDTTPARGHRAEIETALEAYRLAINSNDVAQLLAVFPDMPQEARDSWRSFLDDASNLMATFTVRSVDISGQDATAMIAAQYAYRLNGDRTDRIDLVVRLRRQPTGWRIVAVN